ncbi:MAG TPA: hypothetical protein VH331_16105 [Allosphingosinicella sp.]|jgi:hypothetical protein|nr:hypothetical protein [Allosphingosinicella sp.]
MWHLFMLALAPVTPASGSGSIVEGMAFGPRLALTCTWFTNLENSRFERCRGPAGNVLPSDDGASIKCLGRTCAQLDAEARRVAHWRKPEPPWGTFTVRLVGRVSVRQHPKEYLGDGTSTVLIEKLVSVRRSK